MESSESKRAVLVVDDEENIRAITARLLSKRGHDVRTAETGIEALELLRAGLDPALVILDVRMPELDGFATLERMRTELGLTDLPVVMLTAQASEADMLNGYGAGADYYLTKPLQFDRLLNIVDYLIGDLTAEQRARLEPLL
jgi:CheY-like chemotaxis protein